MTDWKWAMMGRGAPKQKLSKDRFGESVVEMGLLAEMWITLGDTGILGVISKKEDQKFNVRHI